MNRSRRFLRACLQLAAAVAATTVPISARAEPSFAVRTGYACAQCHLNRTGGGMRTPFGGLYSQLTLPQHLLRWRDGENLLPQDPEARIAFGGDARFQALAVSSPSGSDVFSFEVPEANVYLEGRLVPGHLSVYVDETLGPGGASTREAFALAQIKTWDAYIKAGKFMPPYGWRLPDDAAYIRQQTGFTYSAPDIGVEVGIAPGRWSAQLAIVNGASGGDEENRSKQGSLVVQTRFKTWRFGVSASDNIASGATVTQTGAFGGISLGRVVLLGEIDRRRTEDETGAHKRLIAFAEADLQITRGLNIKFTHDWTDPDTDISSDARVRDSLGVEWIPIPFLQLRLYVRRNDGPPQIEGTRDKQAELEAHIFF